ncbi:acyl-CoA thioesterase [Novosphingobium album (ex Hu et al. 2023)]|uniref:Acyl-CoA thioesterase II n=1 Tax=Novosphingobium album (ex Hu et al. 2023) TaxID=2930093 RepID=A0ABT0B1W7_9SPHN|nr:acyl-CoA thioesterase II [Novosphingobium album (ex Hu et al. 2023)]MCJ2179061.1 acyl-CoA thioesterase II [Novosphingobium album (ex Hu et al. 2023)]
MSETLESAVSKLRGLLTIEELDTDLYRGVSPPSGPGRVYGGQVVAQALAAAARSIPEDKQAHSLHSYFLRPGDSSRPIIYRVLRDFDGRSFANRRVVAMQDGRPILNLAASFHLSEHGYAHAAPMPGVMPPEACPELAGALAASGQPIPSAILECLAAYDVRPGPRAPAGRDGAGIPEQYLWFRLACPMEADAALARVVLAYASDFALITTAVLPHPVVFFSSQLQTASLDHTIWFHATPPVDDWLLYVMDSPWSGHARGFARGSIFDRTGALVASVAQEGLCRPAGGAKA